MTAPCAHCGKPTGIERPARGTSPYHQECWLTVLRSRWREATNPATKAAIESTVRCVKSMQDHIDTLMN